MELSEAVRRRHMTRNFSGTPPGPGVLDRLLEGALRAPSAGNAQGREFVVLKGTGQTELYWRTTTDVAWRGRSQRYEGLSRAPVIILPFADPVAYEDRYHEPDKVRRGGEPVEWLVPFWFVDAAFATMTLLLGAADEEVGAAFLGNFRGEEALRSALGVPERLRWLGAVLLGEPARPDPPSTSGGRPRRTVGESVHWGHW
ncbi:MAG: nitroreductase family protein [Acidimicrobiales bacterium]